MRFLLFYAFVLSLVILCSSSCSRHVQIPETERAISFEDMLLFDYQAGTPDWAHIRISHIQQETDQVLTISGSVQGAYPFYTPIDGGEMMIAGVRLPQSQDNPGIYGPVLSKKPEQTFLRTHLGQQTTFALEGNDKRYIPSFETEAYLPPLLEVDIQAEGMRTSSPRQLDHKGNISIRWNADPNNHLPVLIWIAFHHAERHFIVDSVLTQYEEIPLASRIFRRTTVKDNGYFLLPANVWFKDIPPGTKIEIGLARGTEQLTQKNHKSLRVYYRTAYTQSFALADQKE